MPGAIIGHRTVVFTAFGWLTDQTIQL
jgi:hypothetical protein